MATEPMKVCLTNNSAYDSLNPVIDCLFYHSLHKIKKYAQIPDMAEFNKVLLTEQKH